MAENNINSKKVKEYKLKTNYCIIKDADENNIVIINDIRFRGKRSINWDEVEQYLKEYIGEFYEIADSKDIVYIGKDFPDEFSGSIDTSRLKGTLAKAKANAAQGLPQLIQCATNKRYKENLAYKHKINAKMGWYRYTTRFALPVYDDYGEIERYNVFRIEVLVRQADDKRMYLYDLVNIKKKRAPRFSHRLYGYKPISYDI